jgi:hypothetical protein
MTTFARGVSAPKQGVGAFTRMEHTVVDRQVLAGSGQHLRSAITADAAERQAIRREQAWIDKAAFAGIRMAPRG